MDDEVLIKAEQVSKKFCRSLKRALWYGVCDVGRELLGAGGNGRLRPGEFWPVRDVSFEVRRGECLGLIGPNGAGKSTLLKLLNGLIKPDLGRIAIRGRVSALIGLGTGFNPILTGRENIYNNAAVLGLGKRFVDERLDAILDFAEIGDAIDAPVQSYSSGMKVRLGFAVAAQMEPDVLLVDEVLAVGDAGFRAKCYDAIAKMFRRGAVILVSHQMGHINRLCNRVLLMNRGAGEVFLNPADAIDRYIAASQPENACEQMRYENGARLTNLKISGPHRPDEAVLGEPLSISFDLSLAPEVDEAVIFLTVLSGESLPVAYATNAGSPLGNRRRTEHVRFRTDQLVLSHGKYSLGVVILDGSLRNQLLWYQGVSPFFVQGEQLYRAGATMLGAWDTEGR